MSAEGRAAYEWLGAPVVYTGAAPARHGPTGVAVWIHRIPLKPPRGREEQFYADIDGLVTSYKDGVFFLCDLFFAEERDRRDSSIVHRYVYAVEPAPELTHGGERVEKPSLRTVLHGKAPIGLRVMKDWCASLLRGLEILHRFGLGYGRLCPENVLLDQNGSARLRFFDIVSFKYSRERHAPLDAPTRRQLLPDELWDFGTARQYAHPTWLRGFGGRYVRDEHGVWTTVHKHRLSGPASVRMDLFSLGCILCELYTGVPLFPPVPMDVETAAADEEQARIADELLGPLVRAVPIGHGKEADIPMSTPVTRVLSNYEACTTTALQFVNSLIFCMMRSDITALAMGSRVDMLDTRMRRDRNRHGASDELAVTVSSSLLKEAPSKVVMGGAEDMSLASKLNSRAGERVLDSFMGADVDRGRQQVTDVAASRAVHLTSAEATRTAVEKLGTYVGNYDAYQEEDALGKGSPVREAGSGSKNGRRQGSPQRNAARRTMRHEISSHVRASEGTKASTAMSVAAGAVLDSEGAHVEHRRTRVEREKPGNANVAGVSVDAYEEDDESDVEEIDADDAPTGVNHGSSSALESRHFQEQTTAMVLEQSSGQGHGVVVPRESRSTASSEDGEDAHIVTVHLSRVAHLVPPLAVPEGEPVHLLVWACACPVTVMEATVCGAMEDVSAMASLASPKISGSHWKYILDWDAKALTMRRPTEGFNEAMQVSVPTKYANNHGQVAIFVGVSQQMSVDGPAKTVGCCRALHDQYSSQTVDGWFHLQLTPSDYGTSYGQIQLSLTFPPSLYTAPPGLSYQGPQVGTDQDMDALKRIRMGLKSILSD